MPTVWEQRFEERMELQRRKRRIKRVNSAVWEIEAALLELRKLRETEAGWDSELFRALYYLQGLSMQAPLPKKR